MHRSLGDFHKYKGQLIAISPLLMENAIVLKEKLALTFTMTIDSGNRASHQFGLAYFLVDQLQPVYEGFGVYIPEAIN